MRYMLKKKIFDFALSIGIKKCGVAEYNGKKAIVCLFPYFSGNRSGNLSLYAHSEDYHKIVTEKLTEISDYIKSISGCETECFCDIGPSVDRLLAFNAGLGFYGKNQMLINDEYGSYFFIGYVLCKLDLEPDSPINKQCISCGKCIEACPGGALFENGFDINKCASHISQKKGELTDEEVNILKKSALVFGCDICQRVCPHNENIGGTMEEFTENLMPNIDLSDIENLSNREFMKKYGDRAFSWRGKAVIARNLKLIQRSPVQ